MQCEAHKLGKLRCNNLAYCDVTISGDNGSINVAVCEKHLQQLSQQAPVSESAQAKQQRKQGW